MFVNVAFSDEDKILTKPLTIDQWTVGSRALSFSGPLLSVDVNVCLFVGLSTTLRSNISETKAARG